MRQIRIRNDLNKYNMHKAINKKAHKRLSFSPFMIKLLPSKKVIVVPVSVTLNFEVSKSSLALLRDTCKNYRKPFGSHVCHINADARIFPGSIYKAC